MTFGLYIKTIKKKGQVRGDQKTMAVQLFKEAGVVGYLTEDTVDPWIRDRGRPDGAASFPNGINESGVIKYFKGIIPSTWPDIRDEFKEIAKHSAISFDTEVPDVFFDRLLDQFYDLLGMQRLKVSLRRIIPECQLMFGREVESGDIDKIFELSNYAAITGLPGIGKSCLALTYAHRLLREGGYTVQFVKCEEKDMIRDAVQRLEFDGLKNDAPNDEKASKFDSHIEALKKCRQPTLIVFDNLNQSNIPRDGDTLKKLTGCGQHIKLLITSRESKVFGDKSSNSIRLKALSCDDLLKLYEYHRFDDDNDHRKFMGDHKELLEAMFEKVHSHTLTIVFLAKIPRGCSLTDKEIADKLNEGLDISSGAVRINSSGSIYKIDVRGLMKRIINIASFDDTQRCIMRHMALVPFGGIKLRMFGELTRLNEMEIFKLIDGNWITMEQEDQRISLHPLVAEVILDMKETIPTIENCKEFVVRLWAKDIQEIGTPAWYDLHNTRYRVIQKLKISYSVPLSAAVDFFSEYIKCCLQARANTGLFIKEYYGSNEHSTELAHCLINVLFSPDADYAVQTAGIDAIDEHIELAMSKMPTDKEINDMLGEHGMPIDTDASGEKIIDLSKMLKFSTNEELIEMYVSSREGAGSSYVLEDSKDMITLNNIYSDELIDSLDIQSMLKSPKFRNYLRKCADKTMCDFVKNIAYNNYEGGHDEIFFPFIKQLEHDLSIFLKHQTEHEPGN